MGSPAPGDWEGLAKAGAAPGDWDALEAPKAAAPAAGPEVEGPPTFREIAQKRRLEGGLSYGGVPRGTPAEPSPPTGLDVFRQADFKTPFTKQVGLPSLAEATAAPPPAISAPPMPGKQQGPQRPIETSTDVGGGYGALAGVGRSVAKLGDFFQSPQGAALPAAMMIPVVRELLIGKFAKEGLEGFGPAVTQLGEGIGEGNPAKATEGGMDALQSGTMVLGAAHPLGKAARGIGGPAEITSIGGDRVARRELGAPNGPPPPAWARPLDYRGLERPAAPNPGGEAPEGWPAPRPAGPAEAQGPPDRRPAPGTPVKPPLTGEAGIQALKLPRLPGEFTRPLNPDTAELTMPEPYPDKAPFPEAEQRPVGPTGPAFREPGPIDTRDLPEPGDWEALDSGRLGTNEAGPPESVPSRSVPSAAAPPEPPEELVRGFPKPRERRVQEGQSPDGRERRVRPLPILESELGKTAILDDGTRARITARTETPDGIEYQVELPDGTKRHVPFIDRKNIYRESGVRVESGGGLPDREGPDAAGAGRAAAADPGRAERIAANQAELEAEAQRLEAGGKLPEAPPDKPGLTLQPRKKRLRDLEILSRKKGFVEPEDVPRDLELQAVARRHLLQLIEKLQPGTVGKFEHVDVRGHSTWIVNKSPLSKEAQAFKLDYVRAKSIIERGMMGAKLKGDSLGFFNVVMNEAFRKDGPMQPHDLERLIAEHNLKANTRQDANRDEMDAERAAIQNEPPPAPEKRAKKPGGIPARSEAEPVVGDETQRKRAVLEEAIRTKKRPDGVDLTPEEHELAQKALARLNAPEEPAAAPESEPTGRFKRLTPEQLEELNRRQEAEEQGRGAPPRSSPVEYGLWRALHGFEAGEERWAIARKTGATDAELQELISREFGISGGQTLPDGAWGDHTGGKNPRFEYGRSHASKDKTKLQGKKLIEATRRVLGIPQPTGEGTLVDEYGKYNHARQERNDEEHGTHQVDGWYYGQRVKVPRHGEGVIKQFYKVEGNWRAFVRFDGVEGKAHNEGGPHEAFIDLDKMEKLARTEKPDQGAIDQHDADHALTEPLRGKTATEGSSYEGDDLGDLAEGLLEDQRFRRARMVDLEEAIAKGRAKKGAKEKLAQLTDEYEGAWAEAESAGIPESFRTQFEQDFAEYHGEQHAAHQEERRNDAARGTPKRQATDAELEAEQPDDWNDELREPTMDELRAQRDGKKEAVTEISPEASERQRQLELLGKKRETPKGPEIKGEQQELGLSKDYGRKGDQEELFDGGVNSGYGTGEGDEGSRLEDRRRNVGGGEGQIPLFDDLDNASGRSTAGALPDGREAAPGGVRTLASRLVADFKKHGHLPFTGQEVKTAKDLAVIAQLARDPRTETARYFYMKDGRVVAHEAFSTSMPSVAGVPQPQLPRVMAGFLERIRRTGADAIAVLHNHPSGNPSPSPQDVSMTREFWSHMKKAYKENPLAAGELPKFLGHVIIDHDSFAVIDENGQHELERLDREHRRDHGQDLPPGNPQLERIKDLDRAMAGDTATVWHAADVAAVGKHINSDADVVTLIYVTPRALVRAVQEMPRSLFERPLEAGNYMRGAARRFGAGRVFAYDGGRDRLPYDPTSVGITGPGTGLSVKVGEEHASQRSQAAAANLIEKGVLTDYVVGPGLSARAAFETKLAEGSRKIDPNRELGLRMYPEKRFKIDSSQGTPMKGSPMGMKMTRVSEPGPEGINERLPWDPEARRPEPKVEADTSKRTQRRFEPKVEREPPPRAEPEPEKEATGLGKLFTEDHRDLPARAVENVKGIRDDIREALSLPEKPDAKLTAGAMRENLAKRSLAMLRAQKALWDDRRHLNRNLDDAGRVKFLADVEAGNRPEDPRLGEIHDRLREVLDGDRAELQRVGKLKTYIDNYFPHLWKKRTETGGKAAEVMPEFYGKKPYEGTRGFLKQRKYPTIADGLEAGLRLKYSNPVDAALVHHFQVGKFVAAMDTFAEMKASGHARFIPAAYMGPKDWRKLPDSFGEVRGSNKVPLTESTDARLHQGLRRIGEKLGLEMKREPVGSLNGPIGWTDSSGKLFTRFGSTMGTFAHEIGHQLDWKYPDLWDELQGKKGKGEKGVTQAAKDRAEVNREMRGLADLREMDPSNISDSRKQYLHKREEKMANVFDAYVNHYDLFKEIAPKTFERLEAYIDKTPQGSVLRDFRALEPSLVRDLRPGEAEVEGKVIKGHWYAPKDAVKLFDRHLGPTFSGHPLYDAMRGINNGLNQFQLGFSAFHAGTTSMNLMIHRAALGLMELKSPGQRIRGAADLALGLIPGANLVPAAKTILRGRSIVRAAVEGELERLPPEIQQMISDVQAAGGRFGQDAFYSNKQAMAFRDALDKHAYGSAIWHAPWALLEKVNAPIQEYLVPYAKVGALADMIDFERRRLVEEKGGELTRAEFRHAVQRAQQSVDYRFGQVIYDNHFLNRRVKELGMIGVRSLGWSGGTIGEVGGGLLDAAKAPKKAIDLLRGQKPEAWSDPIVTHRMAYTMMLPVVVGLYGALYQYLRTGKAPESALDYFHPRTGGTNPDGSDERVSMPSYWKDVEAYKGDWSGTLLHKLSPSLALMAELFKNQDYYGQEIVGEDDDPYQAGVARAKHVLKAMQPFSVQGFQRMRSAGDDPIKALQPGLLGITPAPKSVTQTAAAREMDTYGREHRGTAARTAEEVEHSRMVGQVEGRIRRHDPGSARELVQEGVAAGKLGTGDLEKIASKLQNPVIVNRFKGLPLDEKLKVFTLANDTERSKLRAYLLASVDKAVSSGSMAKKPRLEQDRIRALLRKAFPEGAGAPAGDDTEDVE